MGAMKPVNGIVSQAFGNKAQVQAAVVAALTENSGAIGGTNDGNLPALVDPSGDAGATVIAAIRENATKINAILTALKAAGIMASS